jgi:hypothetical protein
MVVFLCRCPKIGLGIRSPAFDCPGSRVREMAGLSSCTFGKRNYSLGFQKFIQRHSVAGAVNCVSYDPTNF